MEEGMQMLVCLFTKMVCIRGEGHVESCIMLVVVVEVEEMPNV